jgi:hypothetical protein
VVPPGALPSQTTLSVTESTVQQPSGALTALFQFGPDGTTFTSPVTVTFTVPAGTTAASIYWSKQGNASEYTSLPTTISGTTATAQVTHFSSGYVGALDISGTWTGSVSYKMTAPGGSPSSQGTYYQAREISQTGAAVSYTVATSTGWTGTCTGTISGTSISATATDVCHVTRLNNTCSMDLTRTETVDNTTSPMSLTTQWSGTEAGSNCPTAGYTVTGTTTLTQQIAPTLSVAGTWDSSYIQTINLTGGGASVENDTATKVRTQTGTAVFTSATTTSTGATYTCVGPLIGDVYYAYCEGSNGACTFHTSQDTVTFDPNTSPTTATVAFGWTFGSACGGKTTSTGTGTETFAGP